MQNPEAQPLFDISIHCTKDYVMSVFLGQEALNVKVDIY